MANATPALRSRLAMALCALFLACHTGRGRSSPARSIEPSVASAPTAGRLEEVALEKRTPPDASPALAVGMHGAVTSAEANASAVGLALLERGGNAVDAAVAMAFALGVTHPSAGNIGGGGFMLVRSPDGRSTAIDYREVAPHAAHRDMYLDASGALTDLSQNGPLAAGVPGVVAGLALAHARYGSLPWAELVAPAVRLARDGWRLDALHAGELAEAAASMRKYAADVAQGEPLGPDRGGRRDSVAATRRALSSALAATLATFAKPNGEDYLTGELWRQPELATTLALIAEHGPAAFYLGALAQRMVAELRAMGGIWTLADLAGYQVIERAPIVFSYHDHEIITMPPPSAGGVVLRQILAASDALGLGALDWDSVERIHLYVEILRRTYADRNELIGDPAFVRMPLDQLLRTDYTLGRMASIDRHRATPSSQIRAGIPAVESKHTTHFSVVDASGMAVANTYTLNTDFGARVQIPGTGVTLNNEMDDFTAKVGAPNAFGLVQGAQNAIEPGKRMLSSMSPTIVTKAGKLRAVLGSPGGPTITTTVAQILMQLIDHGRSLERAVQAPRVHHQWMPDEVWYESGLPSATRAGLAELGHRLELEPQIGEANCIEVDLETRRLTAVADVERGGGQALAY